MNNVVLIGRLARDPELRYGAESQNAIARFTIAVDRPMSKDREADFISCVAFGKTAEFIEKYFTKGKQIAIQGNIRTGSYTNKDGQKVYTTDVQVDRVEFVGSKSDDGGASSRDRDYTPASRNDSVPEGFQAIEDDDLPF